MVISSGPKKFFIAQICEKKAIVFLKNKNFGLLLVELSSITNLKEQVARTPDVLSQILWKL